MAEAITAAPPAPAPAAAPPNREAIAATAAKATVNVSELPRSAVPEEPPKPGSARERIAEDLRKKFGGEQPPARPAAKPKSAAAPKAAPAEQPTTEAPAEEQTPADQQPPAEEQPAEQPAAAQPGETDPKSGKRLSPWKLVDQFKERATRAEARVLELEKQVLPPEKVKETQEKLTTYEKQLDEMREELRYHNAEKYDPEVIKANTDFQNAWKAAMGELKDLSVFDPATQQQRPFTNNDLFELVNMNTLDAQQICEKAFGGLASEVMAFRREIKRTWEAKAQKLEELKKNGAERAQKQLEASQKQMGEIGGFLDSEYKKALNEATAHPELGTWLKPMDGDQEWNGKLEKAVKFVDGARAQNPLDPKLTPAQRAEAVRQHAAVRNRAIAYTPLKLENARLKKQLADANKEISELKETEPHTTGRAPGSGTPTSLRGMAAIQAELAKRVRPGT